MPFTRVSFAKITFPLVEMSRHSIFTGAGCCADAFGTINNTAGMKISVFTLCPSACQREGERCPLKCTDGTGMPYRLLAIGLVTLSTEGSVALTLLGRIYRRRVGPKETSFIMPPNEVTFARPARG